MPSTLYDVMHASLYSDQNYLHAIVRRRITPERITHRAFKQAGLAMKNTTLLAVISVKVAVIIDKTYDTPKIAVYFHAKN